MVVLNDVGLTLEIMGFVIFLFVPITEGNSLIVSKLGKIDEWLYQNQKTQRFLRYLGISLIIIGLIMQYQLLNLTS